MSDSEEPTGLPADHQRILDTSRLTQHQSRESVARAKSAMERSRFRLQRSAERLAEPSEQTALPEGFSTPENPE